MRGIVDFPLPLSVSPKGERELWGGIGVYQWDRGSGIRYWYVIFAFVTFIRHAQHTLRYAQHTLRYAEPYQTDHFMHSIRYAIPLFNLYQFHFAMCLDTAGERRLLDNRVSTTEWRLTFGVLLVPAFHF